MSKLISGTDRNQYVMTSLESLIDPDNEVRVIDAIVDSLDLKKLGFYFPPTIIGRPAYSPYDLLKLYYYGYKNKVRSSRKLMKLTSTNIEVIWLLRGLNPDFRSISDFRINNGDAIKEAFKELNRIYRSWNLLPLDELSQDGVKIRAVNSKDRNFTYNKLDDRIKRLNSHIDEYLEALKKEDALEEEIEQLNKQLEQAKETLKNFETYKKILMDSGNSQLSLTDPDCKLMFSNGAYFPAYNVQASVASTHLVGGFSVSNHPADTGSLLSTTSKIKEDHDIDIVSVGTDKGYFDRIDMMNCLLNGIIPNVTLPRNQKEFLLETTYIPNVISNEEKNSLKSEMLSKCLHAGIIPTAYKNSITHIEIIEKKEAVESDEIPFTPDDLRDFAMKNRCFTRDISTNTVYCPAGEILRVKSQSKTEDKIHFANKLACKNCKHKCTSCPFKRVTFKKNQTISIPKDSPLTITRDNKTRKYQMVKKVYIHFIPNKKQIKERMGLSEHPHGSMKRNDDASYFLLKGLNKVEIETALYYSAFNLRRVIKILGVTRILELLEVSSDPFIHSLIKRLLLSKQSLLSFQTVSPPWCVVCDLLTSV